MYFARTKNRFISVFLIGFLAGVFSPSAAAQPLPADLDAVPRNATCFMHFRAAELWKHDVLADVRYLVKRAGAETLKTFQEMFAPDPANIDRVTLVMPTPNDFNDLYHYYARPDRRSPLIIIRTNEPFDYLRVVEKLAFRDKFFRRHHYYFNEEDWRTLVVIDARTFLVGSEASLFSFFQQMDQSEPNEGGPLQAALEVAAGKHHATIGINPRGFASEREFQFLPGPLKFLFDARCWTATVDLGKALNIQASLDFPDAKSAQGGEKACRAAIELARNGLKTAIPELERSLLREKDNAKLGDLPGKFGLVVLMGAVREADRILAELPVERKQNRVSAGIRYDKLQTANHAAAAFVAMLSAFSRFGYRSFDRGVDPVEKGKEDPRQVHLKKIAKALENYHQDKGHYPPAAIYDKYGRPILSWRVALLPYFGAKEKQLYGQFRLDEPWDGPSNKKLIDQLPECYRYQNYYSYRSEGKTISVAFTGKGTVFEMGNGVRKKDIAPKTIQLLLGNSRTATYWTRPGDVRMEPGKAMPKLFPRFGGGNMYAMLADGTFLPIQFTIDKKKLHAMIYRKKGPIKADPAPVYPKAAWQDFIQIDNYGAKQALDAIRKLAADPEKTLPFLKSKLNPAAKPNVKRVQKLIKDLGSRNFATRERATGELTKYGVLVLNSLRQKLRDPKIVLELRRRIRQIVKQAEETTVTPDDLRAVRSTVVLLQIGNTEARALLSEYAKGAEDALLTIHARKALRILAGR